MANILHWYEVASMRNIEAYPTTARVQRHHTMNQVFIVQRQGIYAHEILGVFGNQDAAEKRAESVAENDNDDYHAYVVLAAEVDQPIEDAKPLVSYEKGRGPIKHEPYTPRKPCVFREKKLT